MKFIGITGGIGSGKSFVLDYIEKHYNAEIYYADLVAANLKRRGNVCYEPLVKLLGDSVLDMDREIDPRKMADVVYLHPEILEQVNGIIHPAVKQFFLDRLKQAEQRGTELFIIEAALLVETGYKEILDELWYVYADKQVRIERLQNARGLTLERIENIMKYQLSDEAFFEAADFVIQNSGELDDTYDQIRKKLEDFEWHR